MPEFPSGDWLNVYVERINSSSEYREAAATWEGDICYVFEAEPDKGVPEDLWAWLDLWHGECRGGKYGLTPEEGEKAKFIIRAPYSRWKEVINKELDPAQGDDAGEAQAEGRPADHRPLREGGERAGEPGRQRADRVRGREGLSDRHASAAGNARTVPGEVTT